MGRDKSSVTVCSCRPKRSFLGEITLAMLLEVLDGQEILYKPTTNRSFAWFVPVIGRTHLKEIKNQDINKRTLYLCHEELGRDLLDLDQSSSCIILVGENQDWSWVKSEPYAGRVVVVQQSKRFYSISTAIQQYFNQILIWENKMDRFLISGGRSQFGKLVAISQEYLQNYVCITENAYNFIVSSDGMDPQEGLPYHNYQKDGCFDTSEIAFIEEEVIPLVRVNAPLAICPPDESHPFTTFHYPIYIDGQRIFHVVMVCEHGSVEAMKDLFSKFIDRFEKAVKEYWCSYVDISAPWHRLFNAIIDGGVIEPTYYETQIKASALPKMNRLRLLLYRFDDSISFVERSRIVNASKAINNGNALPFMHYGELVIVCYADPKEDDTALSIHKLTNSAEEIIHSEFGIIAGLSSLVASCFELREAYLQAETALSYRHAYESECALFDESLPLGCLPFDYLLKYYLLEKEIDQDLVAFSFKNTILSQLIQEDKERGTEIATLILAFIGNNHNGTRASATVHAHRNTVLYHIARVEERFDISFKNPLVCQRFMLDYFRHLVKK